MPTISDYFHIIGQLNDGRHDDALRSLLASIRSLSGADDVMLYEVDRDRDILIRRLPPHDQHDDSSQIYEILVESLDSTPHWQSQDKSIQAIHLKSMNKSVGVLILLFQLGVPSPHLTPDIQNTLDTLTGLTAYIIYSEQRHKKSTRLASIISQLAEVAAITANASADATQGKGIKEVLLRKTLDVARKITDIYDKEQCISHIGLKKQRQVLHPDHKETPPRSDDKFLTIQYLFYEGISAPNEEQEKALKDRLNEKPDWKAVPLDIDPLTGQDIDPQQYPFGIAGYVALTGNDPKTNRIYNDIPNYCKTHGNYIPLSETSQSQLSVPMNFGDETIGVLSVEHPELNAYTKEDQDNLQLLATLVTGALSYIDKSSRLEAFQEAFKSIDAHQNEHPKTQAYKVIEIAMKLLDARAAGLYMYDTKEGKLEKFIITPSRRATVETIDPRMLYKQGKAYKQGMAGYLYNHVSLDFLIVDDYNKSRYRHTVYRRKEREFPSVLKVKVRSRSADEGLPRVIGILDVDAPKDRQFTVEDARVLLSLADQAGLALTRAQTIQEQNNWRSITKLVFDDLLTQEYKDEKEIVGQETDRTKGALYKIVQRVSEIVRKNQALQIPAQPNSRNSISLYLYHPQSFRLQYPIVGAGFSNNSYFDEYQDDQGRRLNRPIFLEPWESTDPNFYIADNVDIDRFAKKSPEFTKKYDIQSYIAIRLNIHPHLIGVLFINFNQQFEFDNWFLRTVLEPIHQGVQAAIKHLDQQRRVLRLQKALETLSEISESIRHGRDAHSYENILQKIAEEALRLVRGNAPIVKRHSEGKENPVFWGCFSHITEYDSFSNSLTYTASSPPEIIDYLKRPKHHLKLDWPPEDTSAHSLTARVARDALEEIDRHHKENRDESIDSTRFFRYCRDVTKNEGEGCSDYRAFQPLETDNEGNNKILAQISIALLSAEKDLLGVLTVEHLDPDPFGEEDIQLLRLFAGYAAIVIKSAQALGEREYFARTFTHEVNDYIETIAKRMRNDPGLPMNELRTPIFYMSDLRWMAETLPPLMDSLWQNHQLKRKEQLPIREVLNMIREVCNHYKEIEIVSSVEELDQIYIDIDRYAIIHVLENLIRNARSNSDAISDQWTIIVHLQVDTSFLKVSVIDQGKGWVPNGDQFKPLYKTDKNGIGLVLSRRLIALHKGELDGQPNYPRGALVWFTLPLNSKSRSVGGERQ